MITAVVCSDDRMKFVCRKLSASMEVKAIDEETDFLSLPELTAIVLPVKGIDDFGYIKLGKKQVKIPTMFWELQKNMLVFSGLETPYVKALKAKKWYYMQDQTVIKENAVLTAEGVLLLLLSTFEKSIYELQVDVVGYGNCGRAIFQMLSNLDVNVRVIRRDCEESKQFIKAAHWDTCGDVIIHTSIQQVIDGARLHSWQSKPLILDISTPDVIDLKTAAELGIRVVKESNLPGRYCAKSAGDIIACFVRGKLGNEK